MATSYKKKSGLTNKQFKPVLEEELNRQFNKFVMKGVLIGWNAFAVQAIENIKDMNTVEEIKAYFQAEADRTNEKLNGEKDKNVE